MTRPSFRITIRLAIYALTIAAIAPAASAQAPAPIVYTVRIIAPETHFIDVEAVVPTGGRQSIEMMMPIWSPGYYRVEDYAAQVSDVAATDQSGKALTGIIVSQLASSTLSVVSLAWNVAIYGLIVSRDGASEPVPA